MDHRVKCLTLLVFLVLLQHQIVADYMWHNDEFPYIYSDRCTRGQSYYTSNPYANITTIEIDPPKESLLDYDGRVLYKIDDLKRDPCKKDNVGTFEVMCYFCVCGTDGIQLDCIRRDNWFCDYYRDLRNDTRNYYRWRDSIKYDRQSYFRDMSFRLRRTMDNAIFDYLDDGGDALCCDHPNGHRKSLHDVVETRMMELRKKVPKENLLGKAFRDRPLRDYEDFIVNND